MSLGLSELRGEPIFRFTHIFHLSNIFWTLVVISLIFFIVDSSITGNSIVVFPTCTVSPSKTQLLNSSPSTMCLGGLGWVTIMSYTCNESGDHFTQDFLFTIYNWLKFQNTQLLQNYKQAMTGVQLWHVQIGWLSPGNELDKSKPIFPSHMNCNYNSFSKTLTYVIWWSIKYAVIKHVFTLKSIKLILSQQNTNCSME